MSWGRGRRRRRPARGRGPAFRRVQSRVVEEEQEEEMPGDTLPDSAASVADAPIEASQLTAEQRAAAERALRGESLFLTGAAGTGKSFLLRYLVQELERLHSSRVAVTAPTGIAAANVGGQTIHSFAGVGLGVGSMRKLLGKVKKSAQAVERWKSTRILVLDEISMLDADLFDALGSIASSVRGSRKPFGGLQLLICGDFLQLPPVQARGEGAKRFAFQGVCWRQCGLDGGTVVLKEAVRQSKDPCFARILNEVRVGVISLQAERLLAACHVDTKPAPDDSIVPTKLYCLNKNVDAENAARLGRLPGTATVIRARDHFKARDAQRRAAIAGLLEKKVPAELKLKEGAQVILLKNQPALGLVNGSRGVVEGFEDGRPLVRFDGGQRVHIGRERFEQGRGGAGASMIRIQVPLKLGWALTVHKAQGMTLSRAELQIDDAFESGQAYVALSRLTDLAGLWLRGGQLSSSSVFAHPDVLDFYETATLPGDASSAACIRICTSDASDAADANALRVEALQQKLPSRPVVTATAAGALKQMSQNSARQSHATWSQASQSASPRNWSQASQSQANTSSALHVLEPLQCSKRPPLAPAVLESKCAKRRRPATLKHPVVPSRPSLGAVAEESADPYRGWVSPPKTWGDGVIDID